MMHESSHVMYPINCDISRNEISDGTMLRKNISSSFLR